MAHRRDFLRGISAALGIGLAGKFGPAVAGAAPVIATPETSEIVPESPWSDQSMNCPSTNVLSWNWPATATTNAGTSNVIIEGCTYCPVSESILGAPVITMGTSLHTPHWNYRYRYPDIETPELHDWWGRD